MWSCFALPFALDLTAGSLSGAITVPWFGRRNEKNVGDQNGWEVEPRWRPIAPPLEPIDDVAAPSCRIVRDRRDSLSPLLPQPTSRSVSTNDPMLATLRLRPADAFARTAAFAPILRSSASPHHHRFNCFSTSSPTMAPNDPYTAKAMSDASPSEKCVWLSLPPSPCVRRHLPPGMTHCVRGENHSPKHNPHRIEEMRKIVKEAKFGMLVTRSADGQLHSRAMAPASHKGLVFQFIANTDCACPSLLFPSLLDGPRSSELTVWFFAFDRTAGKFDELENDAHVNVAFSDPNSTDWASVSGTAKVVKDEQTIKDLWNPMIKSVRPRLASLLVLLLCAFGSELDDLKGRVSPVCAHAGPSGSSSAVVRRLEGRRPYRRAGRPPHRRHPGHPGRG